MKTYKINGSHLTTIDNVKGVKFTLWAPNALQVCVIGQFNDWDGNRHLMKEQKDSGLWELFIAGLNEGEFYKFEIKSKYGEVTAEKLDPYAFFTQTGEQIASVVYNLNNYEWNDYEWMNVRGEKNWLESPLSIYEVHLGSWKRKREEKNRFLTYRELAKELPSYVKKMGYTHIELLPIMEHLSYELLGYQTIGYFSCTGRYGKPEDLMYFVDQCHQQNIGIILDWIPSQFPQNTMSLILFDGTCLYEHEELGNLNHHAKDILTFNFEKEEVKNFLISSALFWLEKYHLDGFRVPGVDSILYLDYKRKAGEWIPNDYGSNESIEGLLFLKEFNETVHEYCPGIVTIASDTSQWSMVSRPTYVGGLGFSLVWNKEWKENIIEYLCLDPVYRQYHHNNLAFAITQTFNENTILALSHYEIQQEERSFFDRMPGDLWQKFANLRLLTGYLYTQPGKKHLFMGIDIAQTKQWNYHQSLDWHIIKQNEAHKKYLIWIHDLNHLYKQEPALHEVDFSIEGFQWIDIGDYKNSIVSFMRKARNDNDFLVCIFNFTPVPRKNYRVGVPENCLYKEILNSDFERYGGSGMKGIENLHAEEYGWQSQKYSLSLNLPPLGVLILKPVRTSTQQSDYDKR